MVVEVVMASIRVRSSSHSLCDTLWVNDQSLDLSHIGGGYQGGFYQGGGRGGRGGAKARGKAFRRERQKEAEVFPPITACVPKYIKHSLQCCIAHLDHQSCAQTPHAMLCRSHSSQAQSSDPSCRHYISS